MCQEVKGVHSKEDLQNFVAKVQSTEYDIFNLMPYRFFLITDYKPGESAIVMMGHHSFTDGLQMISLFQALTVEKDFSELPASPEFTFW